ncbi:hypothetical protein PHSC3_000412 [Chlamydiales bacterium STE3]|nr:hypothetical protein PHSC3_000412 [Chlamydiales bacterium STE3]
MFAVRPPSPAEKVISEKNSSYHYPTVLKQTAFSQHSVSDRITQLSFQATRILGLTESGSEAEVSFTGKADFLANPKQFHYKISQLNDGTYKLRACTKGLGGGNSTSALTNRSPHSKVTLQLIETLKNNMLDKSATQSIEAFIKRGADVNFHLKEGYTGPSPLLMALLGESEANINLLLKNSCSAKNTQDLFYQVLLGIKTKTPHCTLKLLRQLYKAGADIHFRTPRSNPYPDCSPFLELSYVPEGTLADIAFVLGQGDVFKWLLSVGVEPDAKAQEIWNFTPLTPSEHAIQIAYHDYIREKDPLKNLELYIKERDWETISLMLDANPLSEIEENLFLLTFVECNAQLIEDESYFKQASQVLKRMISKRNQPLHSLIDEAINQNWQNNLALFLLDLGAVPSHPSLVHKLLLSTIVRFNIQAFKQILRSNLVKDIHFKDRYGNSILYYAALYERRKCIKSLLKQGGDVRDIPQFSLKGMLAIDRIRIVRQMTEAQNINYPCPIAPFVEKILTENASLIKDTQLTQVKSILYEVLASSTLPFQSNSHHKREIEHLKNFLAQLLSENAVDNKEEILVSLRSELNYLIRNNIDIPTPPKNWVEALGGCLKSYFIRNKDVEEKNLKECLMQTLKSFEEINEVKRD